MQKTTTYILLSDYTNTGVLSEILSNNLFVNDVKVYSDAIVATMGTNLFVIKYGYSIIKNLFNIGHSRYSFIISITDEEFNSISSLTLSKQISVYYQQFNPIIITPTYNADNVVTRKDGKTTSYTTGLSESLYNEIKNNSTTVIYNVDKKFTIKQAPVIDNLTIILNVPDEYDTTLLRGLMFSFGEMNYTYSIDLLEVIDIPKTEKMSRKLQINISPKFQRIYNIMARAIFEKYIDMELLVCDTDDDCNYNVSIDGIYIDTYDNRAKVRKLIKKNNIKSFCSDANRVWFQIFASNLNSDHLSILSNNKMLHNINLRENVCPFDGIAFNMIECSMAALTMNEIDKTASDIVSELIDPNNSLYVFLCIENYTDENGVVYQVENVIRNDDMFARNITSYYSILPDVILDLIKSSMYNTNIDYQINKGFIFDNL